MYYPGISELLPRGPTTDPQMGQVVSRWRKRTINRGN